MKRFYLWSAALSVLVALLWWFSSSSTTSEPKNTSTRTQDIPLKTGEYVPTTSDRDLQVQTIRSIIKSGKGLKEENITSRIEEILVFDATIQMDVNMSVDDIIETMNSAGVAMALLHDVDRGVPTEHRSLDIVKDNPSRFLLGAPKMTQLWKESPEEYAPTLTDWLEATQIQAVGEIHLHNNCKTRTDHAPVTIDPDSKHVHSMARFAASRGVPLFVHYEPMKEGSLLDSLDSLFSSERDTNFIWAHGGWETAEVVNDMLSRHPNLYITIAKRIGPGRICDDELQSRVEQQREILTKEGRIKKEWRKVLRFHSQKILYASDAQVPELLGDHYVRRLDKWRAALARDLKPRQVRRILQINAIQLFAPDVLKQLKAQKKKTTSKHPPPTQEEQEEQEERQKRKLKKQNRTK
jgi:hypothetical protein